MANRRRGHGVDATGRSRGDRFIKLDHGLMNSEAWQALSPDATKVLFDLWRRHNGTNNGDIAYSRREAHECLCRAYGCNVSTRRPNAALKEIQDKGFAVVTKVASFNMKTRLARTWRLTAESAGDNRPTRDFRGWQIQNTGTSTVPDGDQCGPCDPRRDPEKQAHGDRLGPCNGAKPSTHGDRTGPTSNIPRDRQNEQTTKPTQTAGG